MVRCSEDSPRASRSRPLIFSLIVFIPAAVLAAEPQAMKPDAVGYRDIITPFLKTHCVKCHGPEKKEGQLRVDQQLKNEFLDPASKGKWGEVVNVLNSHEMPPEGEPQPKPEKVARVVDSGGADSARRRNRLAAAQSG